MNRYGRRISVAASKFPANGITDAALQATIRDREARIIVGINLERFTEILDTCGSSKRSVVLPRDAHPFILHPDSILVWFWEWVMLGVACVYFWEVRRQSVHQLYSCTSAISSGSQTLQKQFSSIVEESLAKVADGTCPTLHRRICVGTLWHRF